MLGKRTRRSTAKAEEALQLRKSKRVCKPIRILEDGQDERLEIELPTPRCTPVKTIKVSDIEHSPPTPATVEIDVSSDENYSVPSTPHRPKATFQRVLLTPRHRIGISGAPRTPQTAQTGVAKRTIYNDARKALGRGSGPSLIIGRDSERLELTEFISSRIANQSSGCLYVSGPPGTGKSALTLEVVDKIKDLASVQSTYVNCMTLKTSADVLALGVAAQEMHGNSQVNASASNTPNSSLLVLDEIDVLLNWDSSLLYNIFEKAMNPASRLIVIGIANALDLTDRLLPRLKARNLKPALLPFLPYTASDIAAILTSRCRSLLASDSQAPQDWVPILHPTAVQLISKKVASQTGDLRKAFDITQRAIDLVELETKDQMAVNSPLTDQMRSPLSDKSNSASSSFEPNSPGGLTAETAPRVSLSHVVRATSTTFGHGSLQRIKALNLQQKAVLCALLAIENKKRLSDEMPLDRHPPTIRALCSSYAHLCKRENLLHALSTTDIRDVVSHLESCSLVSLATGKNGSISSPTNTNRKARGATAVRSDACRVSSCVEQKDVEAGIEGVGSSILKGILFGEAL